MDSSSHIMDDNLTASMPSYRGSGRFAGRNAAADDQGDVDLDIRSMLLMLWRRKLIIVGLMIVGIALATFLLSFVAPRYTARSLVLIETDSGASQLSPELQSVVSMVRQDSSLILNEIEIIRSRISAQKVIERLDLVNDPEFNMAHYYALREGESGADGGGIADRFKTFSFQDETTGGLPSEVAEQEMAAVVTRFLANLKVRAVPGSNVIEIEFQSYSSSKAALIANAVADEYIEQRLAAKFEATRKLTDWLDRRLGELRNQIRTSELAVQKYKQDNNITEGARTVMTAEQLSQLNSQLISAKAKQAEAVARLKEIENLAQNPARMETALDVINSPLIQQLKQDESNLLRTLSDLDGRYGDRHPEIINLRTELSDLRSKIRVETEKIVDSMRHEAAVAQARVAALQQGIDEMKTERYEENTAMVQLGELMREAESNNLIFEKFLQTYKRSDEQEELQEAEARVLSYAAVPTKPSYPDRLLILSLATTLSLFVGLALALLLERLDNTFRSAGQLERMGGFPCYALIPSVADLAAPSADLVLSRPSSTAAESVRTLRTVLNLRATHDGERARVVTITSSLPGEGKTTLAGWLARLAAKSGERVILIDGDLRRPNVHKTFGHSNENSIVEYLSGKKSLEEVVYTKDPSGLHVLFAKSVPNSALDLISSEKMSSLVAALRKTYDLVIIDSPACLAVSDARVLASLSDHTMYAVMWDRTQREVVLGGVKQFYDMDYENLAFVLTSVDVKKHVRYGYGDTAYYHGRYKEYYTE